MSSLIHNVKFNNGNKITGLVVQTVMWLKAFSSKAIEKTSTAGFLTYLRK